MSGLKRGKDGFSLIEMIIAIAIVGIVMSGVILLISYSTNNMNRTHAMVEIQNESKDAMLHMTTYLQESTEAKWVSGKSALIVVNEYKKGSGEVSKLEVGHYWLRPDVEPAEGEAPVPENKKLIFLKNVTKFECSESDNILSAPETVADDDPEHEESDDLSDTGRYYLCFCKKTYSTPDSISACYKDGAIDYSESGVGLDYDSEYTGTSDGSHEEEPEAETPSSEDSTSFFSTSSAIRTGGKYMTILLKVKNANGVAEFTSKKQVYLRNQ